MIHKPWFPALMLAGCLLAALSSERIIWVIPVAVWGFNLGFSMSESNLPRTR